MARISNGINGEFSGKVGTVVGATWKGIPYIRSRPKKRTNRVSEKEKTNRSKFALAHAWLQPVLLFVREGFKAYSPTVEGFLAAKSDMLKNAFEIEGQQLVINPAKVKVSHGSLPLPADMAVQQTVSLELTITWNTTIIEGCSKYDQVMLLAYDIENRKAFVNTTGQFRSTGKEVIAKLGTGAWHVYAAFTAADRSRQSDSVYLGTVTI